MKRILFLIPLIIIHSISFSHRWKKATPQEYRRRIIESARYFFRKQPKKFVVRGKRFNFDCSGFVLAVLYRSGINLSKAMAQAGLKSGVQDIYVITKSVGKIHRGKPRAGDFVFFDRTYDANKNGKYDDPLTHIGIVEGIRKRDGTVIFYHLASGKIKREYLNLRFPRTYAYRRKKDKKLVVINSFIRRCRKGESKSRCLAGSLFRAFGNIFND